MCYLCLSFIPVLLAHTLCMTLMQDLCLDHHGAMPYGILWSNLDMGMSSRAFDSGGNPDINGNHSSSFTTLWNIR